MDYVDRPKLARSALTLLTIYVVFGNSPSYGAAAHRFNSFAITSRRLVRELARGDAQDVIHNISSRGILVVERYVDWDDTNAPKQKPFGLSVEDMDYLVWKDDELRFEAPDFNEPEFRSIIKQFQGFVMNTEYAYPSSICASLNTHDAWESRILGPAIQGKLASNNWWYIYLTRENHSWKVWRLEVVGH
jgi:hypothetical protein